MKVRKDRLTLLANILEALDGFIEPKFCMGVWTASPPEGIFRREADRATTPKALADCSTSACAAGFAASIPAFQAEGFHIRNGTPQYKDYGGHAACQEFFGLNPRQCARVFGGSHLERTLKNEVDVIRRFVRQAR